MNILLLPSSAFVKHSQTAAITATITDGNQLHHIKTVLGANLGDTLKIGALGGQMGTGVLSKFTDNQAVLNNITLTATPPAKLGVTLILALPRPKVLRRLIMDMTAIGVDKIVLINSYRTDKSYWGSPLLARIDDFVHEGLQQGVDTVVPNVYLAKCFKPFVQDELPSLIQNKKAVVFHPYAEQSFGEYQQNNPLPSVVIVGAEGGFIPYEIELLQSVGVQAASLGSRILRTESAVNAVLGRWLG
ncbi:MAG: 16S rRNA (uracil(1498)-N(3))-methyltransferase [Moraxella sp.]|nr:16S rRNA (uracil(1498)-N(3))-methyltransferase [Moraxella sp.]